MGNIGLKNLEKKKRLKETAVTCLIDGKVCMSEKHLSHYISVKYNMTKPDYVEKYIFNFEKQLCKCGCGGEVAHLCRPPYRRDYITGHNPNGMIGRRHKISSRRKMSKKAIERYGITPKADTLPERKFERILKKLNVPYIKQIVTDFGVVDFKVDDKLVEIDGVYWHPLKLENLNLQLIQCSLCDRKKNINIPNLIRIRSDDVDKITSISDLDELNSIEDYPTKIDTYTQVIASSEYIKSLIDSGKSDYLERMSFLFLDIIRTFHPQSPNHHIKSHWKNDEKLIGAIEYLIGLNKDKEVFDISIHNLAYAITKNNF